MSRLDRSLIASLSAFQGLPPVELDRMVGQARSLRIARSRAVFEIAKEHLMDQSTGRKTLEVVRWQ